MKKWMKWNVANEPITEQDVVAIAAIGMLLGGVIVWFVFAVFWGYRVFEDAGSAADWAAALGTAVVGAGAWKIASDSHKHKISESRRHSRNEAEAFARRAVRLRAELIRIHAAVAQVDKLRERPDADRTFRDTVRVIDIALKAISGFTQFDDFSCCSTDEIDRLAGIELFVIRFRDMTGSYRSLKKNDATVMDIDKGPLKVLFATTEQLLLLSWAAIEALTETANRAEQEAELLK